MKISIYEPGKFVIHKNQSHAKFVILQYSKKRFVHELGPDDKHKHL